MSKTTQRLLKEGDASCEKSTGAVCETKAGARRPGQVAPNGVQGPGEARAGTGSAASAESVSSAASAAAPAGAAPADRGAVTAARAVAAGAWARALECRPSD